MRKTRLAVLVSGSGSNLEAILEKCKNGNINAEPVIVISNNPNAFALKRAERFGIHSRVVNHKEFKIREDHEKEIVEVIKPFNPDVIILAGYMRIITDHLINLFYGKRFAGIPGILNIHPADTKDYKGMYGYEYAMGIKPHGLKRLKETKITVHFVDKGIDTGMIISQKAIPIFPEDTIDTLKERGLKVEHNLYSECINLYANGKIRIINNFVEIDK
jgi:phosphoribosylglycinamide formyltransferase-1